MMHPSPRQLFAAIAFAASTRVPHRANAQAPAERAVRAVVDSFFTAVAREKWDSAAALIDVARFEPYFKQAVGNSRAELPTHKMTVEEMMATDSTMPRAVAEWEIARMNKYRESEPLFAFSHEF